MQCGKRECSRVDAPVAEVYPDNGLCRKSVKVVRKTVAL